MEDDITHGTTNVFADLNFPDAAERQTKTRLALTVNELLMARKLKQRDIAELLHVPQPKVSALKHYRLDQFSVEKLMEFLTALDQDVEIMIRSRGVASGAGHLSVLAVQRNSKRQLSRARAGGGSFRAYPVVTDSH